MKIVIFSPTSTKINSLDLDARPLGGADQTLIRMIKILKQVHEVKAFIPIDKKDNELNPFMDVFKQNIECDILIIYRKAWVLPRNIKFKKVIFYSQDDTDSPCFNKIIPYEYFKQYDKIITLSKYHKQKFIDVFGIENNKLKIIGNAAEKQRMNIKQSNEFIYCSTPFRGLIPLIKIWKNKIIKKYPDSILHVFSSMKIYDGEQLDELHFNRIYEGIKKIKGIKYYGSRTQKEVLSIMNRCSLLLYPNTFPETYCNVLMEARACGTPFITSDLGALKETGEQAGVYIKGSPYTEEYQKTFFNYFEKFKKDNDFKIDKVFNCSPIRTWTHYEHDLIIFLGELNES